MKFVSFFTGTKDPAFNRRAAAAALVILAVFILLAALYFVFQASAAGPDSIEQLLPTAPTAAEPVQPETEPPSAEVTALQEALAAAETERDALREQLSEARAEAGRLRGELEALRLEQETVYVLRFRVERNIRFPDISEIISFTQTVDRETYELWEPGDVITDHTSFLTLPNDGLLHHWTVILEDKYITAGGK